ncbi:MAG: YbaN family protein [Bryobacteraceae bacterium]|nr:YbaN family protein [Bryobacteraceae bacterium]
MSRGSITSKLGRGLYLSLGWCCVALGFAGVFIPGLPTTVFILAASYCFARSSPRFQQWLLNHRWFGPSLRRFRESGGMPRSAKVAALTTMWIAVLLSAMMLSRVRLWAAIATLSLGVIGTLTILFGVRTVAE